MRVFPLFQASVLFACSTVQAQHEGAGFGDSFTNDPTARTWLPWRLPASSPAPEVDALLKPLRASLRLLACWYDGSQLAASRSFTGSEVSTPASKWNCAVRLQPVADDKEAVDLNVTFKLREGAAMNAGVAVAFDFANWSTNNYVLVPAAV
jgi:hypothetical protein